MNNTFYWHDYETFGTNARRDRPAQFAGVRTDMDLNLVEDPTMIYCQPSPDYVPHPEACLLTGITPQVCMERGMPEHEFAKKILELLGRTGTIGVGYNTIKFDDEITRFMLWRCLQDPYGREWQNSCGRWDIINMVRAAHALRPGGINWPMENERAVFNLSKLTEANGLKHDAAHDALSDVLATVGLAKLVKQEQPNLFEFCLKLRQKREVEAQIRLGTYDPVIYISTLDGGRHGGIMVLIPMALHPTNKNDVIAWDLLKDPQELFDAEPESLRARLYKRREDMEEGEERVPLCTITINKSPVVIHAMKTLTQALATKWNIDLDMVSRNAQKLREQLQQGKLGNRLSAIYGREFETADPDEDLYGQFVSNSDRNLLARITALKGIDLANEQARVSFADQRLHTLLFRYRARAFPQTLSDAEMRDWQAHIRARTVDGAGGHRTIAEARRLLCKLAPNVDKARGKVLVDFATYLDAMEAATVASASREYTATGSR